MARPKQFPIRPQSRVHPHQAHPERWLLGGFLAVISIVSLFLAAYAQSGGFYVHGLALFGICTLWIFHLMRKSFDEDERQG